MGNEIYKEAVTLGKKCLFTAPYHSVVEKLRRDIKNDEVPILTIDSLLGLADNDNVEDKRYLLKNIDIVFVDEFMVCKRHHLRLLYENKLRYGFKVVLMGHFSQGAPFGETALPYTNSVYMALVNYNLLLLNENKRCEDTELNAEQDKIDQYVIKNGNYKSYPHEETKKVLALLNHGESRRNIAYHIDVVEKVNQHYIKKESALADNVIQGPKYKYYVGMPIMSTKNETKYKNGQVFFIGLITALSNGGSSSHEKILLFSGFDPSEGMEESIEVTKRQLFDFVPAYCITSFKARGQTIRAPHTIWEYDLKNLPANDLYIMISRSTLREHILIYETKRIFSA
jgi:ATP-dependent exoDNAse (exonuclease V) alpha subunit